jgi:Holliday junction resolvase
MSNTRKGNRLNARRGADYERAVRQELLRQGHTYVIRSAASKSPVDLVAWTGLEVLFVQCKSTGTCSAMRREAKALDAIVSLAVWSRVVHRGPDKEFCWH